MIPSSDIIKSTVHSIIPDSRILLFGSMAVGSFRKDSDFDVLIITKKNIFPSEKINWISKIHKALVYALDTPVDVIMNSEDEVNKKRKLPGHIVRCALSEGIEL